MAKRVKSNPVLREKPSPTNFMYAALFVITLLVIVAIIISVRSRSDEDELTAWATKNSKDLHNFMQICKQNDGDIDTTPRNEPTITFSCTYLTGQVEYFFLQKK
jgi:hypothetical protein